MVDHRGVPLPVVASPPDDEPRASRAQLRAILRGITDMVVEIDNEDRLTWVSPSSVKVLGSEPESLVGSSLAEVVHPEDMPVLMRARENARAGVASSTYRFLSGQGGYRWLSAVSLKVGEEPGLPAGRVIGLRDVDQQVRSADALAESEDLYRLLAENTNDVVGTGDNNGTITWLSESVTRVLGWSPEDLIGQPIRRFVHGDDLPMMVRMQHHLLEGDAQRHVVRLLGSDGSYRWFDIMVKPVRDEHGNIVARVAGWRDVHDEQIAVEQLKLSQESYRLVAENAADVLLRSDHDDGLVSLSRYARATTGWDEEQLGGDRWWDLVHPEDVSGARAALAGVLEGDASFATTEARMRGADGEYTSWAITARLPADDSGVVLSLRDIHAEVAERRRAEAEQARRIALLDSMLDPHVLLQAVRDEEGTITDYVYADANEAACRYNQMSREELIGARLMDLLPGHRGTGLMDLYSHTVNTGEPLILDDYTYPHEILAEPRRFDIRGVKVGDALSFTWRDVTDRSVTADRLAASEARFRLLAENASDVVVLTRDQQVDWVSPSLTRMLGWGVQEWLDRRCEDFVHPADLDAYLAWRQRFLGGGTPIHRTRLRDQAGNYRWVEVRASLVPVAAESPQEVVTTIRTIEEVMARERALTRQATVDGLTGALQRAEALRRLAKVTRRRRRPGAKSAVVFCDIDLFKRINDTLGHVVGDEVLRETAGRIRSSIRDSDLLARMGGDEFLVLLDGVHSLEEAAALADKIRRASAMSVGPEGSTIDVTLSVGVTLLHPGEDTDDVIARADQAMYAAKQSGRDAVAVIE